MKTRIENLPDSLPVPFTHQIEFVRAEGELSDPTLVYRYIPPKQPARIDEIPHGVRLIGGDLHRLQYTHTTGDGVDVYKYVESVHSVVDGSEHDEFVNSILEAAPEAYDEDGSSESIAVKYVRDLEWVRDYVIQKLMQLEEATELSSTVVYDFAAEAREQIQERTKTWPEV